MHPPDTPDDEAGRLAALQDLEILDTPAKERFDRITRMAQETFGTDIALVSIVDSDRQWFKSTQGLNAAETPRASSFCAHAICSEGAFVVPDTHEDERFRYNPLVTGHPDIRFYAGQPIRHPTGHMVGTLCVIDSKPRQLKPGEVSSLRDMALLVENELRHAHLSNTEALWHRSLSAEARKSSIDPLTRVWTRRAILQLLELDMGRAIEQGEAIGVAMIAIDGFDATREGHPDLAADLLALSAGRIRAAVTDGDLLGRYAAEAFLVVIRRAETADLTAAADRIKACVCGTTFLAGEGDFALTGRVGLACLNPGEPVSAKALIAAAHQALLGDGGG